MADITIKDKRTGETFKLPEGDDLSIFQENPDFFEIGAVSGPSRAALFDTPVEADESPVVASEPGLGSALLSGGVGMAAGLGGAKAGAALGTPGGPIGMGVGAVGGGLLGTIGANLFDEKVLGFESSAAPLIDLFAGEGATDIGGPVENAVGETVLGLLTGGTAKGVGRIGRAMQKPSQRLVGALNVLHETGDDFKNISIASKDVGGDFTNRLVASLGFSTEKTQQKAAEELTGKLKNLFDLDDRTISEEHIQGVESFLKRFQDAATNEETIELYREIPAVLKQYNLVDGVDIPAMAASVRGSLAKHSAIPQASLINTLRRNPEVITQMDKPIQDIMGSVARQASGRPGLPKGEVGLEQVKDVIDALDNRIEAIKKSSDIAQVQDRKLIPIEKLRGEFQALFENSATEETMAIVSEFENFNRLRNTDLPGIIKKFKQGDAIAGLSMALRVPEQAKVLSKAIGEDEARSTLVAALYRSNYDQGKGIVDVIGFREGLKNAQGLRNMLSDDQVKMVNALANIQEGIKPQDFNRSGLIIRGGTAFLSLGAIGGGTGFALGNIPGAIVGAGIMMSADALFNLAIHKPKMGRALVRLAKEPPKGSFARRTVPQILAALETIDQAGKLVQVGENGEILSSENLNLGQSKLPPLLPASILP